MYKSYVNVSSNVKGTVISIKDDLILLDEKFQLHIYRGIDHNYNIGKQLNVGDELGTISSDATLHYEVVRLLKTQTVSNEFIVDVPLDLKEALEGLGA